MVIIPDLWAKLVSEFALAIAATGAAAALTERLLRRGKPSEDVDKIAATVRDEQEGRKAAIAEVLAAQAIGENASPERFREVLQTVFAYVSPQTDAASKSVAELVNNYHEQALSQAKIQFWFSVVAATVGFIWILYSGTSIQADKLVTISKTFPGIVMDAVAVLFFRQAAETRQRATELYDRLRRDKQMAESAAIVASIEDIRLRSAVKAQLALHMSGLEPKPIDLGSFLSAQGVVDAHSNAENGREESRPIAASR